MVDVGPKHLIELRELLYETVKMSSLPCLDEAVQFGFAMTDEQVLQISGHSALDQPSPIVIDANITKLKETWLSPLKWS